MAMMKAMKMTWNGSLIALALVAATFSPPHAFATPAGAAGAQAPRDRRPGDANPATPREIELQKTIAAGPASAATIIELAKLQEDRGAAALAEATLNDAVRAQPGIVLYHALAGFHMRQRQPAQALEAFERAAALDPTNATLHHSRRQLLLRDVAESIAAGSRQNPPHRERARRGGPRASAARGVCGRHGLQESAAARAREPREGRRPSRRAHRRSRRASQPRHGAREVAAATAAARAAGRHGPAAATAAATATSAIRTWLCGL